MKQVVTNEFNRKFGRANKFSAKSTNPQSMAKMPVIHEMQGEGGELQGSSPSLNKSSPQASDSFNGQHSDKS